MKMKNILITRCLCAIAIIVAGWPLSDAAVQRQKEAVQRQKEEVLDIFFSDQQHGWLVTSTLKNNRGFLTVDGGDTWVEIDLPANIYKLFFLDSRFGWALGVDTRDPQKNIYSLFRTLDGGLHWTQTPIDIPEKLQPVLINDFLFVDARHGWFVGHGAPGGLVFSVNGGGGLKEVNSLSRDGELSRIVALDGERLWMFGHNTIVASADRGKTWERELKAGTKVTDYIDLRAGLMLPDGNGWAAGISHGPVVLHSRNFGKSWQESFRPPEEEGWFHDIHFGGPERGCAIAESNILYCTTDSGKSWSKRYLPITRQVDPSAYHGMMRVLFSNSNTAWLIGDEGLLFRSNDGGRSWNAVTLSTEGSPQHP